MIKLRRFGESDVSLERSTESKLPFVTGSLEESFFVVASSTFRGGINDETSAAIDLNAEWATVQLLHSTFASNQVIINGFWSANPGRDAPDR